MAATKTKRPTITLPPITDSIGARKEYERALRAMLRSLAATVRSEVLPAAEAEIARQRSSMTQDALGEFVFEGLKQLAVRLGVIAEGMVGRILRLESERHTKKWLASVRSTIGIDLAAVVSQEDLADYLIDANRRNAGLIQSLARDTVAKIERATYDAVLQGQTAAQLRKRLTDEFGVADRRAKIIARDQVAKTTSDLNRLRHVQAGVTSYTWMTSRDERVRPRHKELDGKEYEYGKPTGAEQGLPPGQPIMCRCVARGIVVMDGERF
ncbi:minor capsid protein [Aurantimonas litoralis]|nr:minor capsid protein [Aurantimonas litoralis]